MDLVTTVVPGLALAVGLAWPRVSRAVSQHSVVVHARRTLESSRLVGLR